MNDDERTNILLGGFITWVQELKTLGYERATENAINRGDLNKLMCE